MPLLKVLTLMDRSLHTSNKTRIETPAHLNGVTILTQFFTYIQ